MIGWFGQVFVSGFYGIAFVLRSSRITGPKNLDAAKWSAGIVQIIRRVDQDRTECSRWIALDQTAYVQALTARINISRNRNILTTLYLCAASSVPSEMSARTFD